MNKKKAVIFGAGGTGGRVYHMIKEEADVLFFVDNDEDKWGKEFHGLEIKNPDVLKDTGSFDMVVLGTLLGGGRNGVQKQLQNIGVPLEKLEASYVQACFQAKNAFVKRFSEMVYRTGLCGSIAEAGVYQGLFAKEMNRRFSDRTCFLFDTFEGFSAKDYPYEKETSMTEGVNYLKKTSAEFVLEQMPYPECVVIKKGYFPDTASGIEDLFVFVNLDMDLYKPTIEGLRFFYPKLVKGGIILIHDYFTEIFPNVEKAVADFEKEMGLSLHKMPIGDDISLAIVK